MLLVSLPWSERIPPLIFRLTTGGLTEYNRLAKRRQRQLRSLNSLDDSEGAEVGELLCGAERERAGVVAGPDVVPTAEAVRREPGKSKLFWCIPGA